MKMHPNVKIMLAGFLVIAGMVLFSILGLIHICVIIGLGSFAAGCILILCEIGNTLEGEEGEERNRFHGFNRFH